MCAILDVNCIGEVFNPHHHTKAGEQFYKWLEKRGMLVIGGSQFQSELSHNTIFSKWEAETKRSGKRRVRRIDASKIDEITKFLSNSSSCESNDSHIIALAQISNARLLFSRDIALQNDFKNPDLIKNPRGKIYSLGESPNATKNRNRLLAETDCA